MKVENKYKIGDKVLYRDNQGETLYGEICEIEIHIYDDSETDISYCVNPKDRHATYQIDEDDIIQKIKAVLNGKEYNKKISVNLKTDE